MSTEPRIASTFDVVKRAVEVCDASGVDAGLGDLLQKFEDDDAPIGEPEVVRQAIDEAVGSLDPDVTDGGLQMAGAVATYLAFRRDEIDQPPADIIRLAARAEYPNDPPTSVALWLAQNGFET